MKNPRSRSFYILEQEEVTTLYASCRDDQHDKLLSMTRAAIALGENGVRERELAFGSDPFMLFGDALDTVAGVAGISLRCGNEMTNFIGTRG